MIYRIPDLGNFILPIFGHKQGREIHCPPPQNPPLVNAGTESDLKYSQKGQAHTYLCVRARAGRSPVC